MRSQAGSSSWGGGTITERVAPLVRWGYQPKSDDSFAAFSPLAAAETISTTLQTGLEVPVAELAGVLADDLVNRVADVADWVERLLADGAPPERIVRSLGWSQFWARHGADELLAEHDAVRLAPARGDRSVSDDQAAAAEQAYMERMQELQKAFKPTATIKTISDLSNLAPRLASARTMADLLRRYRDLDAQAMALEGAMEETVYGWDRYVQQQVDLARGK